MFDRTGIWTIVVAAGTGTRFGSATPKQFSLLGGKRVIDWSVAEASVISGGVVVVLPSSHVAEIEPTLRQQAPETNVVAVAGGSTRSESVRAGIAAVPATATEILVHDAARPLADAPLFARVLMAVRDRGQTVVPVADVVDTVRHTDGVVVDRDKLKIVQTPQGFPAEALRRAHASGEQATDDATLVERAGGTVSTVAGDRWNLKLTTADDATVIEALLVARANAPRRLLGQSAAASEVAEEGQA